MSLVQRQINQVVHFLIRMSKFYTNHHYVHELITNCVDAIIMNEIIYEFVTFK